jgi:hypothetical protein
MRALAPLPAFLLLAASAAACPFGFPGHVHLFVESAAPAAPMPEGKCTGPSAPAPAEPLPSGGPPRDLKLHPVPAEQRVYWEMIGYKVDDAHSRLTDAAGKTVSEAEIEALEKPFDASRERLEAVVWQSFVLSGYRLDESSCRLMGPDARPLNLLSMRVWRETARRQQSHTALEALLARLDGLDPAKPVPIDVRNAMLDLAKAGTKLPPRLRELLGRNETTVAELRVPAAASYAESTLFYDGQRPLKAALEAAVPATEPGVAARRKGIVDPDERALGRILSAAFSDELSRHPPGAELLSHFKSAKGGGMPDVMVLKLTQSPNDPNQPGAVYDPAGDRMIINHWEVVRALHARLPPEKLAKIEGRLGDAKQLSKLLAEDPSLLPLVVDSMDVIYFHELTHAAQSRRNTVDDEALRGNLPGANPLAKEHEAHRAHCAYLLSKSAEAIDRSGWRDYCLEVIRDPKAFKDRVTSMYLSTFAGSATLDDVAARQEERRRASRELETGGGVRNWIEQKLKQLGFANGDAAFSAYRTDVDKREQAFNAGVPAMRRQVAEELFALYKSRGADDRALALANGLPPGTLDEARLVELNDRAVAWVKREKDPARKNDRLAAVSQINAFLNERKLPWPPGLKEAYDRDALAMAADLLAQALKAAPADRDHLLDQANAWAASAAKPGDLPAAIARARKGTK